MDANSHKYRVKLDNGGFPANSHPYKVTGIGPGGEAVWGSIGGTLENQTDLKEALDAKTDKAPADGKLYGQKDDNWEEIPEGANTIIYEYNDATVTNADIKAKADEGYIIMCKWGDAIFQFTQASDTWAQFVKLGTNMMLDEISLINNVWQIHQNKIFREFDSIEEANNSGWVTNYGAGALAIVKESPTKTFEFLDTTLQNGYKVKYSDGKIDILPTSGTVDLYKNGAWTGNLNIVINGWMNEDMMYASNSIRTIANDAGTALDFIELRAYIDPATPEWLPVSQIPAGTLVRGARANTSFVPDFTDYALVRKLITSTGTEAVLVGGGGGVSKEYVDNHHDTSKLDTASVSHETWQFTMSDDTVVEKEVMLWQD